MSPEFALALAGNYRRHKTGKCCARFCRLCYCCSGFGRGCHGECCCDRAGMIIESGEQDCQVPACPYNCACHIPTPLTFEEDDGS